MYVCAFMYLHFCICVEKNGVWVNGVLQRGVVVVKVIKPVQHLTNSSLRLTAGNRHVFLLSQLSNTFTATVFTKAGTSDIFQNMMGIQQNPQIIVNVLFCFSLSLNITTFAFYFFFKYWADLVLGASYINKS